MRILIGYDVCTADPSGVKRLRQISQACKDYGQRVQKSLFEVQVENRDWIKLKTRLFEIMNTDEDSIRIYYLDHDTRFEHRGVSKPVDLDGPLIF